MRGWLVDVTDPRIVEALGVKCGVCGAKPGDRCRSLTIIPLNRPVHAYRIQSWSL